MDIGLELGMNKVDLDCIKTKCRGNPDDCFREMLSKWLLGRGATWNAVVSALNSRVVGFGQLAEELKASVCSEESAPSSSNSSVRTEESATSNCRLSTDQKQDEFHEKVFRCPCGQCTLEFYLNNGCPKTQSSPYPYLKLSKLSEDDREDLTQKLSEDTEEIKLKFADLCNDLSDSLKNRGKTTGELVKTVVSYDKSLHEELSKETEIDAVFSVLHKQVSFFNYETVEYIVNRLGDVDDKRNLEIYLAKFKEFCKRRIFEVSPCAYGSPEAQPRKMKFVVQAFELGIFSPVSAVKAAHQKIASLLKIRAKNLQLHCIDDGSILLVLSVPNFIAQDLFPLNQKILCELKDAGYIVFVPKEVTHKDLETHQVLTNIHVCYRYQMHVYGCLVFV